MFLTTSANVGDTYFLQHPAEHALFSPEEQVHPTFSFIEQPPATGVVDVKTLVFLPTRYLDGQLNLKKGQVTRATGILSDALARVTSQLGPDALIGMDVQAALVQCHLKAGNLVLAREQLNSVLRLQKGIFQPDHYRLKDTLIAQAALLEAENKPKQAQRVRRQLANLK